MSNENERVAVLETEIRLMKEQQERFFIELARHMKEEDVRWVKVEEHMSRQKGFIGGAIFIVSSLWAVAVAIVHYMGKV
jgi:hypothetical protein